MINLALDKVKFSFEEIQYFPEAVDIYYHKHCNCGRPICHRELLMRIKKSGIPVLRELFDKIEKSEG